MARLPNTDRRTFLGRLLAGAGTGLLGWFGGGSTQAEPPIKSSSGATQHHTALCCAVAGYQYHQGPEVEAKLTPGTLLELVPDFANTHDENALAVYLGDHHLGYIPRTDNLVLANLLRAGTPLATTITQLDTEAPTWQGLWVKVDVVRHAEG